MCLYNVIGYRTTDGEIVVRVLAGAPDRAIARCREIAANYEQEIVSLRLVASTPNEGESHRIQREVDPFSIQGLTKLENYGIIMIVKVR